ncbi:MAG TPA: DUF5916 domain-containing protein [Gemmatimonadaceae bacterium]|nr:DUF5916 domain-containing protein [Gemmatimonadaceae bacterium]
MFAIVLFAALVAGSPSSIVARRLPRPPALNESDESSIWAGIPCERSFRQWSPQENGEPSFRTEFAVAYDARNLYVFVRAFDPAPNSIVHTLSRRDGTSASDEIGIYLGTSGDGRTGYEFYVNAAGVQRDAAISADSREDVSWDGVWSAAVWIDSLGWAAEFSIPFSQLGVSGAAASRLGLLVNRAIQRRGENDSWPAYHPSRPGIVSQFGVLTGLEGAGSPHPVEATPFIRTISHAGQSELGAGGDVRLGLAPAFTLNATILPDFGQVEADPSVVNLSPAETFFPEHRPFFLDGAGPYTVPFNCNAVNCGSDELFYSRRIGRAPQLAALYGDGSAFNAVPILSAVKLTGRTDAGLTIAALGASTDGATVDGKTIEPRSDYAVARVQQDFRGGQSAVGLLGTFVRRSMNEWTSPYLAQSAAVGGATFRHRFFDGRYEVWGSATESRIAGSPSAITQLQRDGVHFLQRPGAGLDSTRAVLTGDQEEAAVGKYGGAFMFESSFEHQSPGYDSNDMGYLQRADQRTVATWLDYTLRTPRAFYNNWRFNFNKWDTWNAQDQRLENAVNANTHLQFRNNWWLRGGATIGHLGSVVCDFCARGGPALRSDRELIPWLTIQGDPRDRIAPTLHGNWTIADGGRSRMQSVNPIVDLRLSSRWQATLGAVFVTNHDNTQWLGNFGGDVDTVRHAFARLTQRTTAITIRSSYALTRDLTFDAYVAPFFSNGAYSDVRALSATPAAESYDDRFVSFTPPAAALDGFRVRNESVNLVARWEYRPGSTAFLVVSHDATGTALTMKTTYRLTAF